MSSESPSASSPAPLYRPDPKFRDPFTIDTILNILDSYVLSPKLLPVIPAAAALYRKIVSHGFSSASEVLSIISGAWQELLASPGKHKVVLGLMAFIAVREVNRVLSRLAQNNGYYRGDRPNWDNEVVVVTGGSAGIGKEIAVLLAERSRHPIAVLDLAPLTYSHPNVKYFKTNVASEEEFTDVAAQIRTEIGEPTIVVNNAGIAVGRTILDTPSEVFSRVMGVNMLANVYSAKLFLPHMRAINHGHIVTVASCASYISVPSLGAYSMSKAAALSFHETLSNELRTRYGAPNIRTTVVCPMKTTTTLGEFLSDPIPFVTPALQPETVARRIVQSIDAGLGEHLMMPAYTNIMPHMRGLPSWFQSGFFSIGGMNSAVTPQREEKVRQMGCRYSL